MEEEKIIKKKKIKKSGKLIIAFGLVTIVFIILILLLIFRGNKYSIVGKWTTERGTIYQFNNDNSGVMSIPIADYPFTYKINDNKIFIDFENENSVDTEFEFSFDGDKLLLTSKNGTFTFTRVE